MFPTSKLNRRVNNLLNLNLSSHLIVINNSLLSHVNVKKGLSSSKSQTQSIATNTLSEDRLPQHTGKRIKRRRMWSPSDSHAEMFDSSVSYAYSNVTVPTLQPNMKQTSFGTATEVSSGCSWSSQDSMVLFIVTLQDSDDSL